MKKLDLSANGVTQSLQIGDSLEIILPEGATTPYLWEIESVNFPSKVAIHPRFHPAGSTAAGAAGQKIFTIEAREPGTVNIRLKHWDQWQNHVQETFDMILEIR